MDREAVKVAAGFDSKLYAPTPNRAVEHTNPRAARQRSELTFHREVRDPQLVLRGPSLCPCVERGLRESYRYFSLRDQGVSCEVRDPGRRFGGRGRRRSRLRLRRRCACCRPRSWLRRGPRWLVRAEHHPAHDRKQRHTAEGASVYALRRALLRRSVGVPALGACDSLAGNLATALATRCQGHADVSTRPNGCLSDQRHVRRHSHERLG